MRVLDVSVAEQAMEPMLTAMAQEESYFNLSLDALTGNEPEAIAAFDRVYGPELREIMARGLSRLAVAFPAIQDSGTRLIGPTLEGVGWYPRVDGELRLLDAPAWVAGDACGLFRGIVAAMISGHYTGGSVLRDLEALR